MSANVRCGLEIGGLTSPSINLGRPFADFVERSLGNKHGHDLLIDVTEKDEVHEDGVKLVLQSLDAVVGAETEAKVQRLDGLD